jgi:hypothetical protein
MRFKTSYIVKEDDATSILTIEETKKVTLEGATLVIPVIVKLSKDGKVISFERDSDVNDEQMLDQDFKLARLGVVKSKTSHNIDVMGQLNVSLIGLNFMGGAVLMVLAQHQTTGTFAENFRLKSDYLPCLLGTKAGDKWTNGSGYALVNIKNQTVEDIVFTSKSIGGDPSTCGYVLEDKSTDKVVAVSCVMANGGVNFTYIIR